ncbi:MAG: glycosyltransferase family 4 protein [Chloroflexi bacterium]|nr:glycosyltransferase family 4 protein [Chloroflexota bacterium]
MTQPIQVIVSSGGPFHAYHLVRGVHRAGYLKRFITTIFNRLEEGIPREQVRQILLPELAGQAISRLPGAGNLYLSYLVRDNWFDWAARRFVDGGDIFHVFNHFGLYSMRKAKQHGMTTIVERSTAHPIAHETLLSEEYERHGLRLPDSNQRVIDKHLAEYEEADIIMVPSQFVWRTMIENSVPEQKLRRVHFGFDPAVFAPDPSAKQDDVFRIIFVGSISLQKGVQYLLEAFKRLALPNAELLLVGGTFPDSQSFLPTYSGLYRYERFVPHHQLVRLYQQSSVFVLPSIQDGFGMVVYEAAACGLPVITTENVGAEIRDGKDGFVVPIRDPDTLAENLLQLYEDAALRQAMGASARAYVENQTWERYHAELKSHYDNIMGQTD